MDFDNLRTLLVWFQDVLTSLITALSEGIEQAKKWYKEVEE